MVKLQLKSLSSVLSLFLLLLVSTFISVFVSASEPTDTPAQEALGQVSQAFIGKVVSQHEVASPSQYRTREATVEILLPLLGALPQRGVTTHLIYHTEVGIAPCMEVEMLPDGFVGLFTFSIEHKSWQEPRILNYCFDRPMDLIYEVNNPAEASLNPDAELSLRLVSGSWTGQLPMPVPKLSAYEPEPGLELNVETD
jgi:hypothetical protein